MTQFISTSLLLWIIIKSSSSSHHHQVWIITESSSSLDHHWIIITTSAIPNKWCYLSIILIIGSSTEPALFHAGCRHSLHVGIHPQIQPFFMLDVLPCPCKEFRYRANPFSCWMQHLASARISPTEPALFHAGCNTLPLQGFPLQSQPFFMLDVALSTYI